MEILASEARDESFPPPLKGIPPFQIMFVLCASLVGISVLASMATAGIDDSEFRIPIRSLAFQVLQLGLVTLFVLALPAFRLALPKYFARPSVALDPGFLLISLLLALSWAWGLHSLLIVYPSILISPELASGFWGYTSEVGTASTLAIALAMISRCILAPVLEELVCRGLVMGALRERFGLTWAVVLSSAFFGMLHFQGCVVTGVLGAIYAIVAIRYRTLLASILLHATYNTIVSVPPILKIFLVKNPVEAGDITRWIPEVVIAIASIPLVVLFIRRLRAT